MNKLLHPVDGSDVIATIRERAMHRTGSYIAVVGLGFASLACFVALVAGGGRARAAAGGTVFSYIVPKWEESERHPAPFARVGRDHTGATQIEFRWPRTPNAVNSQLRQVIEEDGDVFIVLDRSGKRIFCACGAEGDSMVAFTRTASRDIYYLVDGQDMVFAPLRYGDIDYRYYYLSIAKTGVHYHQCTFKSRLPLVSSPALLLKKRPDALSDGDSSNEIPARILAFLVRNGADPRADHCEEVGYEK